MPTSKPCDCGHKVDRLDPLKLQCMICGEFYHGLCYKIQESEIELIKVNFKCKQCLIIRRRSVSESFVVPVSPNNSASASEKKVIAGASNIGTSADNAINNNKKPATASSSSSNANNNNANFVNKVQGAFEHILRELSALSANNASLKESNNKFADQLSILNESQKVLMKEVSLLRENNVSLKITNEKLSDKLSSLNTEYSALKVHVAELVVAIQASNSVAMQNSKTNAIAVNPLPIVVDAEKELKTKSNSNTIAVNSSPVGVSAEKILFLFLMLLLRT